MAARRYGTCCIPEAPPPSHQEKFTPVKYFSIDRVFRNETLDATHLAEFHQIEGVVADRGLTLGDLMGILHAFFTKLGEGAGARRRRGARHYRCGCRLQCFPSTFDQSSADCRLPPLTRPSGFSFPGITKLRFKPAYNPYTEPSMEVFSYHEGRGHNASFSVPIRPHR